VVDFQIGDHKIPLAVCPPCFGHVPPPPVARLHALVLLYRYKFYIDFRLDKSVEVHINVFQ
jgi:hypothetical protein